MNAIARASAGKKPPRTVIARLLASIAALCLVAAGLTACSLFDKRVEVLYIGDSIMVQTGPFNEAALVAQPGIESVKTAIESTERTGLLTPTLRDWLAKRRVSRQVPTQDPGHPVHRQLHRRKDAPLWTASDGQPLPNVYDQRLFDEWGRQAEKLTNAFASRGTQVVWVLPPPLTTDEGERREKGIRQAYLDLQKRVPSVALSMPACAGGTQRRMGVAPAGCRRR